MLPVIAIVGRPNVGKSTLFNWLTQSRSALVADFPGVTRDRQYGRGVIDQRPFWVIDTGGIEEVEDSPLTQQTEKQVEQAINEANIILFMVDARANLTPADEGIAKRLRHYADKVRVVVNKIDHLDPSIACGEFFRLGLGQPIPIAAIRGQGVKALISEIMSEIPETESALEEMPGTKIAIVGRPNVGKSTLINRLLGEERVIVLDHPGTTRDSIYIPYERQGKNYILIDTAGVRRKARVSNEIEKLSMIKTLKAMEDCDVVIMIFSAHEGIIEQDLRLLGIIMQMGKALVLAINKWDNLDSSEREQVQREIDRRLPFVDFARRYFISALHGTGVGLLYRAVDEANTAAHKKLSTADVTRALEKAIESHQPPLVSGRRIKLRYAHMGGHNPMIIIVHGKQTTDLPMSYKKYLINFFREYFNLVGIPLLVHFKNDPNPYAKDRD